MTIRRRSSLLLAMLTLLPALVLSQTADTTLKQERPGLLAQVKVSPDSARAIARAAVPGGVIRSSELENEDHRLIYSFDIKMAGREGIEEINVDARTGAIVGREHESALDEGRESARPRPRPRARPAPAPAPTPAPAH